MQNLLLYFSITEYKTKPEFLDLMTNLLNVLLSVDFPFSGSKDGIHLRHALGSVHV